MLLRNIHPLQFRFRENIPGILSSNVSLRPLPLSCDNHTARPLKKIKPRASAIKKTYFIDWKRVRVIGGTGGNGAIAFLHLLRNPFGGPSGGDGGNGGHVIFEVENTQKSLKLMSLYHGENGVKGGPKHLSGANAPHTIVHVPVGTIVKDTTGNVLAELDTPGTKFVAARGGTGGKGNAYFLSSTNTHPKVAELGAEGEDQVLNLELKIIAHAGLVGFPNAGKSTLLRAISRARPKVAAYPFTTVNPHIGIIQYEDYEQIAVADLPGLIPDAHKNLGLGISFLKHIERCSCLIYVIDVSKDSPLDHLSALKYELEEYQKGLSERLHAVVANKIDLPDTEKNIAELEAALDIPVIPISAKKGTNIPKFLHFLREVYDKHCASAYVW